MPTPSTLCRLGSSPSCGSQFTCHFVSLFCAQFLRLWLVWLKYSISNMMDGAVIFSGIVDPRSRNQAPERCPRFPLGGLGEFEYSVCAPAAYPAAVRVRVL